MKIATDGIFKWEANGHFAGAATTFSERGLVVSRQHRAQIGIHHNGYQPISHCGVGAKKLGNGT